MNLRNASDAEKVNRFVLSKKYLKELTFILPCKKSSAIIVYYIKSLRRKLRCWLNDVLQMKPRVELFFLGFMFCDMRYPDIETYASLHVNPKQHCLI